MGVFEDAAKDLHDDADLSVAASFRRPPYAWQACRVILSQPTDALGNVRAGTVQADIRAGAIADTPQRGDELRIGAAVHTVEDAERDVLALSWRLTLSSPAAD
jgi:hypothetical protein